MKIQIEEGAIGETLFFAFKWTRIILREILMLSGFVFWLLFIQGKLCRLWC